MPNGIIEDRFNFYSFPGKEFWYGVLGTSQGGSHPPVGARCYLLNKILNKFTQNNLFLGGDEGFISYYERYWDD